jgi:hypothetical protein
MYKKIGSKSGVVVTLLVFAAFAIEAAMHATDPTEGAGEVGGEVGGIGYLEYLERGARLLGAAVGLQATDGAILDPVATLLGSIEGLLAASGAALDPVDRTTYEHNVASARSRLGKRLLRRRYRRGKP